MQNLTMNDGNGTRKGVGVGYFQKISVDYPYISKPLLMMFCGYVFIWYLQIGYRIPALGAIRFEFIYAALLTGAFFLFTPKINTDCPLILYITLYFIVVVVQVPFSYDFTTSWNVFVDRIIKFAFMAFFIVAFVRSPTHIKYFLAAFLLACLKMGQEGLVGRISGSLIWENQGIMRLHGSTPLYAHPNSFAGMALGTLPFIFYLWPLSNNYVRVVLAALSVFSLNIIIFSGSRTGYVGLIILMVYFFLKSDAKKTFFVKLSITVFVALLLIPSEYLGRFTSIYTLKDKEGQSTEKRIEILEDAWDIFKYNPLGIGVSAFPKKRFDTFGRNQDTHNLYLEIATNLGVQGLIIFIALIYKMLEMLKNITCEVTRTLNKLNDYGVNNTCTLCDDLKMIKAAAHATSAFIIARLALGLFGMDLYEIYWWFAIGMTMALYTMIKRVNWSLSQLVEPI